MQRSQRDTARRQDYAAFAANITNYITNNNGKLPTTNTTWITNASTAANVLHPKKYLNESGADSSGKSYYVAVIDCTAASAGTQCTDSAATYSSFSNGVMKELVASGTGVTTFPHVVLVKHAECGDTQGTVKKANGNRDYDILGQLESGVYCQDNV